MEETEKLETELFHIGLVLLAIGSAAGACHYFLLRRIMPMIPCFFSEVVGIYCPGCGGTRAFHAMVNGKLLLSLWYHPLVLYMTVIAGGFMVMQGLNRLGIKGIRGWRYHNWYLYGAIALILGNFLIKNVLRLVWGIMM